MVEVSTCLCPINPTHEQARVMRDEALQPITKPSWTQHACYQIEARPAMAGEPVRDPANPSANFVHPRF